MNLTKSSIVWIRAEDVTKPTLPINSVSRYKITKSELTWHVSDGVIMYTLFNQKPDDKFSSAIFFSKLSLRYIILRIQRLEANHIDLDEVAMSHRIKSTVFAKTSFIRLW